VTQPRYTRQDLDELRLRALYAEAEVRAAESYAEFCQRANAPLPEGPPEREWYIRLQPPLIGVALFIALMMVTAWTS
jgi:hypothetical protein